MTKVVVAKVPPRGTTRSSSADRSSKVTALDSTARSATITEHVRPSKRADPSKRAPSTKGATTELKTAVRRARTPAAEAVSETSPTRVGPRSPAAEAVSETSPTRVGPRTPAAEATPSEDVSSEHTISEDAVSDEVREVEIPGTPRTSDASTRARRAILLVFLLITGAIGSMKVLAAKSGSSVETTAIAGSAPILTEDLVRLLAGSPGVSRSIGSYVPGIGIVLSVTTSQTGPEGVSTWWSTVTEPMAERFATELPNQRIIAVVDAHGNESFARALIIPTDSIAEPASFRLTAAINQFRSAAATGESIPATELAAAVPTTAAPPLTAAPPTSPPTAPPTPITTAASSPESTPAAEGATTGATAQDVSASGSTAGAAAAAPTTTAAALPASPGKDTFETDSRKWTPLSGQWKLVDGAYHQLDNSGFDFISQYAEAPGEHYSVSVKMAAIEGDLNGGLILFQQKIGKRNEATIIDLTSKATYLRWGHYDAGGVYVFDGGAKLATPLVSPKGGELKAEVKGKAVTVFLDNARVGEFQATRAGGNPGLVSSQAKILFDDFTVGAL